MSDFNDKATVSGSVVSIENGADEVGAKSCVVTVSPTLSGVSSVTETQTGRNLLNGEDAVITTNNIRFYYSNGKYYSAGTYTLSISENVSGLYVRNVSTSTNISVKYNSNFITFTLTEKTLIGFDFYKVGINQNDNIMLEYGSTAHAYEPYQTPTQYTASLGRTIYGGRVDIVNGVGESSYKIITVGNSGWNYYSAGGYIYRDFSDKVIPEIGDSDHVLVTDNPNMPYGGVNYASQFQDLHIYQANNPAIYIKDTSCTSLNDFYTKYSDMKIGYELATPTDFTFTGQEVPTRLGYNAFWSDSGDTELTYYKSGYGYTSVTVHKETPDGEPVEQTAKLHKVIYAGEVDVIKGTAKPKNLVPPTNYMTSYFSVAEDGTVSQITTGAPFACSYANSIFKTTLPAGTYTAIEELLTDSTNTSHGVQVFNSSNNMIGRVSGGAKTAGTYSATFTLTEETEVGIVCKLYDGTAKLYIVSGSSASEYAPYFEPFTFPPISMETDEGDNTLYADEGDSAIIYRKQAE